MRTKRHSKNFLGGKTAPACLHIQQQMPLFLDGELSEQQAQSVVRHLSDCPVCQRERELWQQSERALASARQYVPAPGDLRAGFYARLAQSPSTRRSFPRIDWRVAVPTLAACSLAVGWLTTQRSVMPSTSAGMAAASSPASPPQIARVNDLPPTNLIVKTKPSVSQAPAMVSLPSGVSENKLAGRAIARASSPLKRNAHQEARQGQEHSAGQIAMLNSRRNQPEPSSRLELRRRAPAASLAYAYVSAKPADTLGERLIEKEQAQPQGGRQDTSLSAGIQPGTNEITALSKAVSKKKAILSTDKYGLAETMDGVKDANRFSYAMPLLKSQEFGELKAQTASPAPLPDASADANGLSTFALGLSARVGQNTNALRRGLGWSLAASGNEGVDLQVRDSKRGFTNGTRLAGEVQEQNGRRVLIIQAEDAESPTDSASE